MRATAEIREVAAGIERDGVCLDALDKLHLVGFAHGLETRHGVGPGKNFAAERLARRGDFLHLGLNGRKILAGERALHIEIVIKAVVDGRPDGHPGRGKQALDRGGHDMGRGMADQLQAFGRVGINGREFAAPLGQRRGEIQQYALAVDDGAGGHHGLEFLAAQSLLQHRRNLGPGGNVHHLPFHTDIHDKLLLRGARRATPQKQMGRQTSPLCRTPKRGPPFTRRAFYAEGKIPGIAIGRNEQT